MSVVRDVFRAAYKRDPAAFESADLKLTDRANYREHIDAGMTDGDPDEAGLVPLVNDDNGFYLRWSTDSAPDAVVFLGSEGQTQVAARSEAEFVSLVVYGALINDAMKYWCRRLTPPYEIISQLEPTVASLEHYRSAGRPRDAWRPHVIAVAGATGIAIESDPFTRVGAANRALLDGFVELAGRRFKAKPTTGPGPTRTYRATERFEIGERIMHPTFGDGVVEHQPSPGKIAVLFASGRKVLVHSK